MKHVIVCPGCGDPHTTINIGDAPRVRARVEAIRAERRAAMREKRLAEAQERARARAQKVVDKLGTFRVFPFLADPKEVEEALRIDPAEVAVGRDEIAEPTADDLKAELDVGRRAYAALCASPQAEVYTCTASGAALKLEPDLDAPCGFRDRDATTPIPVRVLRHPTGELRVEGRFMDGATVSFRALEAVMDEKDEIVGVRETFVPIETRLASLTDVHVRVENANGWREVLLPIDADDAPSDAAVTTDKRRNS